MYGVRPMDDEECKDYQQMEIARRNREKQNRERVERETKAFRCFLWFVFILELMQERAMIEEVEEETKYAIILVGWRSRLGELTFGGQLKTESKKDPLPSASFTIVAKPKKATKKVPLKKKKKAEKAPLNLLSYGTED